ERLARGFCLRDARRQGLVLRDDDFRIAIALDLPTITGMRFLGVDDKNTGAWACFARQVHNRRGMLSKARRRIRAEYQHHNFPLKRRKLDVSAIQLLEIKIRRRLSDGWTRRRFCLRFWFIRFS